MADDALHSPFAKPNSYVGRTLSRAGATRAVAGRGRYTDDISLPRMLHAAFVRSPHAHARILGIDTAQAKRQPGVVLVMTGAELAKRCTGPWVGTLTCFPGMKSAPQYPMAVDRACWVGEPVVMVVAQTRAQAEDAAERVAIEWQELPAVIDKKTALDPESPVIHAELGDNLAYRKTIDTGDVEAAFANADLVVEDTFDFGRHTAVSLESRAVLAAYDKGTGKLTIHTSSQCPHMIQRVFAQTLGIPDHNVQIIAPDVGGSFGLKIHTYGDEVATTAAAIQLGRPVKFIADRLESFVSDIHARENFVKARMAVSKSGEIQAFDIDVLSGAGAYSQYPRTSVFEANQVLNITGGPYRHKHLPGARHRRLSQQAAVLAVSRRRPPDRQRGRRAPGRPGRDSARHRPRRDPPPQRHARRCLSRPSPPAASSSRTCRTSAASTCWSSAWAMPSCARSRRACASKGIHRGIGIACFIKGTSPGPQGYYGTGGAPISLQDACVIELEPNGGVICAVGVTEQGQGTDTIMAQIAATALGVPMASVRVISGDTDAVPYGGGTFGSRAAAIGGEAVYQAARDLRAEILDIAGVLLQADASTLDIADGVVVDRAGGAKRIPLAEIGRIGHFQLGELPGSVQPVLSHTRRFRLVDDLYIFTNGIHGAYVEVDTDTGFVRLLKHWVVEDCGRVINPQLADEQVRGGCVQGLGGALYEHCLYDAAGQLTNGTMADYLVPMAAEMPDIDVAHVQTPSSVSELGAKGVGESGTGAAPAVVMNAINDALLPFNARVTTQPMTPEVILTALGKI